MKRPFRWNPGFYGLIVFAATLFVAITLPESVRAQGTLADVRSHATLRPNSIFLSMSEPQRFHQNRMKLRQPAMWLYPAYFRPGYESYDSSPDKSETPENTQSESGIEDEEIRVLMENMDRDLGLTRGQVGAWPGNSTFWLNVVHSENATGSDRNSVGYGISDTHYLLGFDWLRHPNCRLGLSLGYSSPTLWQSGDESTADNYLFGGYYQGNIGETELNCWIGYANQQIDFRRRGTLDIIQAFGFTPWYRGSTSGNALSGSVEAARVTCFRGCFFIRPSIGVEMNHAWQGGYTEQAPVESGRIRYHRMHLEQTFLRVGLGVKYESFTWLSALFRVEYAYLMNGDPQPKVHATFLDEPGTPTRRIAGVDVERDYLSLGAGFQSQLGHAGTRFAFADYSVTASTVRTVQLISIGYMEKF